MGTFTINLEDKQFTGNDLLDITKTLGINLTTGELVDLLNGDMPPRLVKKQRGRPAKKAE